VAKELPRCSVFLCPVVDWLLVESYFNYFTEIEVHFQQRRGTGLILSTLDWALIETWKDAGIPLQAVLRGIDTTFDHWERRPSKTKKVNGLAFCSQEVLTAAEKMKEAAVGAVRKETRPVPGLEAEEIARFFVENAAKLRQVQAAAQVNSVASECAVTLLNHANSLSGKSRNLQLEDLERHLTILEEKLVAALTMTTADDDLLAIRREADREIAPYRSKMPAAQIEQLHKQFVHRRLFDQANIPRLSLFYM
jgi:hypothetical protein